MQSIMGPFVPDNYDFLSRRCMWVNGPIIIGAGPSGLAVAASLKERGVPYVILEHSDCIASLWKKRTYDILQLRLPKQFCQLPGLPFPESYSQYPCKKQFTDYLESYAKKFDISPIFNQFVQSARYNETSGLWRVKTVGKNHEEMEYIGKWLVVATGENAVPVVPEMDGLGSFGGQITHACDYKSGEAYRGKKVLVVGCGYFGMEVHLLPREVCGKSTFELVVFLMKWLPLWLVDKILLVLAWLVLGYVGHYGLKMPAVGPRRKIKSGEIEVLPAVKRRLPRGIEFVDDFDGVVMATGYRGNIVSYLLQGTDFFSKNGLPKAPDSWKGKYGLYAVGFTKRGLAADAVKVANDLGKAWKEETKQEFSLAIGSTRRGLAGALADAVKVAKDLGKAWREETKQEFSLAIGITETGFGGKKKVGKGKQARNYVEGPNAGFVLMFQWPGGVKEKVPNEFVEETEAGSVVNCLTSHGIWYTNSLQKARKSAIEAAGDCPDPLDTEILVELHEQLLDVFPSIKLNVRDPVTNVLVAASSPAFWVHVWAYHGYEMSTQATYTNEEKIAYFGKIIDLHKRYEEKLSEIINSYEEPEVLASTLSEDIKRQVGVIPRIQVLQRTPKHLFSIGLCFDLADEPVHCTNRAYICCEGNDLIALTKI